MEKYKMLTAKATVDLLFQERELNFTFDDLDVVPDVKPSSWYGIKLTQIFDEHGYVLAIGYYGGGSTVIYDLTDLEYDYSSDSSMLKAFCAEKLQEFMNKWGEYHNSSEKICVELPDVSNEPEYDEYRCKECEYHREDVVAELETKYPDKKFSDDEINKVLCRYEKNLSNSDDWHFRLTEAIDEVLGL